MSWIIPSLDDLELRQIDSDAEAKLYRALRDRLAKDYLALFQATWILRREYGEARDGEIDFLLAHPEHGFLCVEVKGGGIRFDADTGHWFSIDRNNNEHKIKDPIKQAANAKYSVLHKFKENSKSSSTLGQRICCGHAVFLPDIGSPNSLIRADLPRQLIGVEEDLNRIDEWVEAAFLYWASSESNMTPLGSSGVNQIKNTFARSFDVKPLLASRIGSQSEERLKLTEDQLRVLDVLRSQRRVCISGGAGTGKTVLAVEKAKRLAREGFKTLLVCYNRQLSDHLANVCNGTSDLDVMTFHQLCYRYIGEASKQSGRDLIDEARATYPGVDEFNVQQPAALLYALDVIDNRYDAIVCDEAQDFGDEYWYPIEMLLVDLEQSPLYIFFDENQNLYTKSSLFPISNEPYLLSRNCRNTDPIHHAAYLFYEGEPVSPSGILGDDLQFISAPTPAAQATKIHGRVIDLLTKEKVDPEDVTILIVDGADKNTYYHELTEKPLPKAVQWGVEKIQGKNHVTVDTVKRFKGLESNVIFLWALDTLDLDRESELFYVGLSRAHSSVFISSTQEVCNKLKLHFETRSESYGLLKGSKNT
jgi:hypothetical protein